MRMPMTTRPDRPLSHVERPRKERIEMHPDITLSIARDRHAHDRRIAAFLSRIRSDRDHFPIRHRIGQQLIRLGQRLIAESAGLAKGSSHVSV
jgi:hypothetical protein